MIYEPFTDKDLLERLEELRGAPDPETGRRYTWEKIKDKYYPSVSRALLWKVVNKPGYKIKDHDKRKALGLPVYAPAPVCPDCGAVHTKGHPGKEPRRFRLVAQVTEAEYNAVKAAAEREGVTMAEYIRRLICAENM